VVLSRMYSDGYITEEQLVQALIDGFDIKLKSA
jgi:membrane peptidoglycan carboxypeptidase